MIMKIPFVKNLFFMIVIGMALPLVATTDGDAPKKKAPTAAKPAAKVESAKPALKVESVETPQGVRYESGNRRDPFLNPLLLLKNKQENLDEEISPGQPPPGISGMLIAQVKLLGVSIREDARTVVLQGQDRRAYFLQEGDKLFDGFVKQIGGDSCHFTRETQLKSGKVLTQEITKRLRTP